MADRHDRRLTSAIGAATAACLGYWLPSVSVVSATARRIFRVRATIDDSAAVALTFDDGPHPEGTPAVLAALERHRATATFFLAGEQVERWPELAREVVAAGHDVAVHCFRHRNSMRLTPGQVRGDLERAEDVIVAATGRVPRCYRPPNGILTAPALAHARSRGWDVVLWRQHGRDWTASATPESIAERVLQRLRGGDVVVLHDADHYCAPGSWRRTAAALDRMLTQIEERGLEAAGL